MVVVESSDVSRGQSIDAPVIEVARSCLFLSFIPLTQSIIRECVRVPFTLVECKLFDPRDSKKLRCRVPYAAMY